MNPSNNTWQTSPSYKARSPVIPSSSRRRLSQTISEKTAPSTSRWPVTRRLATGPRRGGPLVSAGGPTLLKNRRNFRQGAYVERPKPPNPLLCSICVRFIYPMTSSLIRSGAAALVAALAFAACAGNTTVPSSGLPAASDSIRAVAPRLWRSLSAAGRLDLRRSVRHRSADEDGRHRIASQLHGLHAHVGPSVEHRQKGHRARFRRRYR